MVLDYKYCPICTSPLEEDYIDGQKRFHCIACGWIDYRNPVPAVACIVKQKNKFLLVKRGVNPQKGKWSLPAGFMELYEKPEEAVLRELKEETGLEGKVEKLIGVYSQPSKNYGTVLTIGYLVKEITGVLLGGDDVKAAKFSKIEDVKDIPFTSHRKMLIDIGFREKR
ncbi:MAG: NUDIX domain-containing protein [Elusimicrobiota bacterium]